MGIMMLVALGLVFYFVIFRQPPKPVIDCPYCGSYNTREMGLITRMDNGGFVGTAGKSHICNKCGRTF